MVEANEGVILIVEDEAEVRFILCAHLRASGYEVIEAVNGQSALELAASQQPDLIIMDIGLPIMDGITVTRTLKADPQTAAIPVIILTARSSTADVVRGLEAGAQEYLPKPFDVAELLARVRMVHRGAKAVKDLDQLNTRLEVEVDIKTRRLRLLYEFMRDLNRADTRDQIFDLLLRCVEQTTSSKRVSLFLKEDRGDRLVCVRALGIDPAITHKLRVRNIEGIIGQVFRSGKTLAARMTAKPPVEQDEYHRDAFLSTPLISTSLETHGGILGVLNATEKTDDLPFSEEEIHCVRSIADAAAIALDNIGRRIGLQQSVRVLLRTVGHLAEYRDEETTLHLERVSKMARILAEQLQHAGPYRSIVTDRFVESLVQAAPMHDIGKVGIPDDILAKPGKLTDEEFQIMKTHADIGRRVLSQALDPTHPAPLLQMCIDIAHCHHERYDGTGYPRRIAGETIPLSARIITLVDAYDAITSNRRYQKARSHEQAVDIVRAESGKHFDPVLSDAFLGCDQRFNAIRAQCQENPETSAALRA